MMRLILLLAASGFASPAVAQDAGRAAPAPGPAQAPTPVAACTPEHAAMGHCKLPAPAPTPVPTCSPEHTAMGHCNMPDPAGIPTASAAPTCTPEHAEMGHCTMPAPAPRPTPSAEQPCSPEHAALGHCRLPESASPSAAADPHAGHYIFSQPSSGPSNPHAGHSMSSAAIAAPEVAPPPAAALSGPAHAADLVFGPVAMAQSRATLAEEHGGLATSKFLIDQLEAGFGRRRETYSWDAQFWYGGDINKLWLKSEGEGEVGGEFDGLEMQALWSRAIDPWFDLQLGVRQDLGSAPDRTHLVVGVQGLAPYWFEVEGAVFVSNRGDVTARAEVEYDLRITQNLILQPRAEADFSLQDVPELQLGSGFTTAELGARLRYELFPRSGPAVVAPYVGVQYEHAFGDTARLRRGAGEHVGGWSFLGGLRTWF
jgi:copper resistance protein B